MRYEPKVSCASSNKHENYYNAFKQNELANPYQHDKPISPFRIVGWYVSFFSQISIEYSANNEDPDQTTQYVISYLGLHYLSINRTIGVHGLKNINNYNVE